MQRTQKVKKRLYNANPTLLFDWALTSLCFVLGWIGIQTVLHVDTWNIWFEKDFSRVEVAHYHKIKGLIRFRKFGFRAWEDISHGTMQHGDELKTKDDSTAIIETANSLQITLFPSSKFQMETEIPNHPQILPKTRSIESWLMGTHPPIPMVFKLLNGSAELQMNESASIVFIDIDGTV